MTIDIKKEEIMLKEKYTKKPFVGYFTPSGDLLDFNILLYGNNHEDPLNPISFAFLKYVSYIINNTNIYDIKDQNLLFNTYYPDIKEYVKRGFDPNEITNDKSMESFLIELDKDIDRLNRIKMCHEYYLFEYKLLLFFKNAYKKNDFFKSIDRKIIVESPQDFKKKYGNQKYEYYLKKSLLFNLKDICIQYLGYDSLERFDINNELIKISNKYNDDDFLTTPRIITSSNSKIYERYYNYILLNWIVRKVPKYTYNEEKGIYEKVFFIESEREQEYKNELGSIKRFVPLNERYKYFI